MDRRVLLGDVPAAGFDPIQGLFQLGAAAIQAGGAVGSAVITADAQQSIAQANAKAALQSQIAQVNAQIAMQQAANETSTQQLQTVTGTITSWPVLLVGLAALLIVTRRG